MRQLQADEMFKSARMLHRVAAYLISVPCAITNSCCSTAPLTRLSTITRGARHTKSKNANSSLGTLTDCSTIGC